MSEHDPSPGVDEAGIAGSDAIGTKTCAHCGAVIDEYEWFPIRAREDEAGEFRVYSFCGEACVERWEGPEA